MTDLTSYDSEREKDMEREAEEAWEHDMKRQGIDPSEGASGPAECWYCACPNPAGATAGSSIYGRLHGPEDSRCNDCGMEAPFAA